ncbi:MAG TPA: hypothetical protein VFI08_03315 [Spirochaetia bacterium]|nr:hypothetical protein [Spirochaetia bacterium]
MDVQKLKDEAKVGHISEEYVDFLKYRTITEIMESSTPRAANALWAYASFLNHLGITPDNYPLYIALLASNNRYAIDALLAGHQPERYLDCVAPNPYIVKSTFETFSELKSNEIYEKSLRVFLGFLYKVYASAQEGYAMYPVSIEEVNSLGKFLDESQEQDWPLNRGILDVLAAIADLDMPHEANVAKRNVAAQAGRIRSDFFDHKRSLKQSITEVILQKAPNPTFGTPPEYTYG